MLTIVFLTYGCSSKDNAKVSNNDSIQTTCINTSKTNSDKLDESIQYIGFIEKFNFSNENEVYIELYFINDTINTEEYNKIVQLTDSLIYEDDENSRRKFPASLAPKYFDLRGLSKLKIYDNNNKFVTNANFLRIEYLEQNIAPAFIAVYETDKKVYSDSCYGISDLGETLEPIRHSISTDTVLTQNILAKLNEPKSYYGLKESGTHLHFSDNDTTLSIINSENFAYIALTTNKTFKALYKSPDYENILDFKIIPLSGNKLPYILTRNVQPDTDIIWDNLLYYNGTEYKAKNNQRIKLYEQ